jgi:uncharacterized protein DUF2442
MTAQNMNKLSNIRVLNNYLLQLEFTDGFEKTVDLSPLMGRGVTSELLDYENFKRVRIEPGGGIEWFNGFDLCPNALRDFKSADS